MSSKIKASTVGEKKPFKPKSGKEKHNYKRKTWLIRGDLPAKGQPGKERNKKGARTERREHIHPGNTLSNINKIIIH